MSFSAQVDFLRSARARLLFAMKNLIAVRDRGGKWGQEPPSPRPSPPGRGGSVRRWWGIRNLSCALFHEVPKIFGLRSALTPPSPPGVGGSRNPGRLLRTLRVH